jgi:multiple sugar transport system substrate-binding protein
MHRRTRGLVAALAAAMALTGLVGCGSGGAGGDGKTLQVLVGNNPQHPEEQRVWLEQIKQKFKARTGADITFETFANTSEEQTKIQTSMVSGTGPDVYSLGSTFVPTAHSTKGFEVFSDADWQRIGGRNRFIPEAMAMAGPDRQGQIAVPMSTRPYGMVYNTAMFKEAGLSGPPQTWDEFVRYAQRLNKPAEGVYGTALDYGDNTNPWKHIWMLTMQSGGRLISDDLKKAQLDTPQVAAAVRSYFDLSKQGIADPKSAGWKAPEALAAFANGKAAMLGMVTPSAVPTLEKGSVKGQYAFAPMPLVPFGATSRPPGGVAAGSVVSGDYLAVANYTRNKDLALAYIEMVTSPEEQKRYTETFGDLPGNLQAAEEAAKSSPQTAAFLQAERTSLPTPFTGGWSDVQLGLTNVVTQSLQGLTGGGYDPATVQQLLAEADQRAQSSLERQGR